MTETTFSFSLDNRSNVAGSQVDDIRAQVELITGVKSVSTVVNRYRVELEATVEVNGIDDAGKLMNSIVKRIKSFRDVQISGTSSTPSDFRR